jgi:hypothetical protein
MEKLKGEELFATNERELARIVFDRIDRIQKLKSENVKGRMGS